MRRSDHTLAVTDLRIARGGAAAPIATCSLDATVRLWTQTRGTCTACVALPGPARCLALLLLGHHLFCGLSNGAIVRVSAPRGARGAAAAAAAAAVDSEDMLRAHTRAVLSLDVSSDGLALVSGESWPWLCDCTVARCLVCHALCARKQAGNVDVKKCTCRMLA